MAVILQKKQIASIVNEATKQTLGTDVDILTDSLDAQGVIDNGIQIDNANAYKNFLENLLVQVAKYIYVERTYTGSAPDILRDNFEYGQLIVKVRTDLDEAQDNQSYMLVDGGSYDDNVYEANDVHTKIFKESQTFEVRKCITNKQIKNAFTNATELGSFISMLFTYVENSLTLKMERLIYMMLSNACAETILSNDTNRAVNLLALYKVLNPSTTLTEADCFYDKEFLRFAYATIKDYTEMIKGEATIFNEEGNSVFTPKDLQHLVVYSKFAQNMKTYLQSDTYHKDLVDGLRYQEIDHWQFRGVDDETRTCIAFDKTSKGNSFRQSYILGILFDHDALGVCQDNPSVETHYVKSAQFTKYWYKRETMYFTDFGENIICFYVSD